MNVEELLSFKPELGVKHTIDSGSADGTATGNAKKRSRLDLRTSNYGVPAPREAIQNIQKIASNHTLQMQQAREHHNAKSSDDHEKRIAEKLEELEKKESGEDQGPVDETFVKKLALNFEKKVLKNQELRIKFPDDPKKFMDTEIELNEAVEEMHVVATVPDLYPLLIELGIVKTFIALLAHENTDISIAVVDLIQEMTDIENEDDSDGLEEFINALMEGQIMATLVHNLQRLDESVKQEADGVHNTLGIIENFAGAQPDICNESVGSGLMSWLLKRLKAKPPFDGNKLYASEILAICVQNNNENQKLLGTMEGIDILLQQVAQYKRYDPQSAEEQEMMENLFNTLCSCLLFPNNRELFLLGEGLQLMNLMLREKKVSRNGALRVLDHALSGSEGTDNCNKFIEILGLRTVFPLFMKTPKKHGNKGLSKEQHEEHVVSILSWLMRNSKSSQRNRLINKFTENDHEKVDRLLELHFKYLEKVIATTTLIENQATSEALDEDSLYLRRLDGGLFTLQLVDYIMIDICASGPPSVKRRVLKILNVRNASIKTIKNIIREYASNLGEENEDKSEEQEKMLMLLDKFQNM